MSNLIFIYGKRGCGMTSNKARFLAHYKVPVYEESEYFDHNTKQLCPAVVLLMGTEDGEPSPAAITVARTMNARLISFDTAMKESA